MGSPTLAALLLLPLLLPIGLSTFPGCPCVPHQSTLFLLTSLMDEFLGHSAHHLCHTRLVFIFFIKLECALAWHCPCHLCLQLVSDPSGLQWGWSQLQGQKSKKFYRHKFCRRHKVSASAQKNPPGSCCLSDKDHTSNPSPDIVYKGLRSKRTQPFSAEAKEDLPRLSSQKHGRPKFSFDLLPEARAVRVTIPPGPEVSVRLCHQWALECEELSSPFDTQEIVHGGHTAELAYEFLLPCLCIEVSYLQEDTVRHKKCPFWSWPEAYSSDFWKSVNFTDRSQHDQMAMALVLRCPMKLEASLCQRQDQHAFCEDLPNATVQESQGWYALEKVDLHPQLCFKFSFANSSHVECPHRTASSWNVSMDTQAKQLVLHFSSWTHASFSAAWSPPAMGQDSAELPVYTVSQTQGSGPVVLDLILPFPRPGGCVLVWRSDVQFARKHLLCPDVSHRHLGLLILALLALATLVGMVLVLAHRRPLSGNMGLQTCSALRLVGSPSRSYLSEDHGSVSLPLHSACHPDGPGPAQPVLLLHAADSEAQRRLVGALADLLRAALGGGRDVIVDLCEGARAAHLGPLPWLWAARARVLREQGAVLLLWSGTGPQTRGLDPRAAPLRSLIRAVPRPRLLLAYFGRLCAKADIPAPLRALPCYRLLHDLPRLLRALDAETSARTKLWGRLGPQTNLQGRLRLCRRLEHEAAGPVD